MGCALSRSLPRATPRQDTLRQEGYTSDDIDRTCISLQHSLSNVATLNNRYLGMRDNSAELLAALRTTVEDTKTVIDAVLHVLPLALLLVLPGCVFDVNKAMQEWAKPTTSLSNHQPGIVTKPSRSPASMALKSAPSAATSPRMCRPSP